MECHHCRLTNHTTSNCTVTDEDKIILEKCRTKISLKQNKTKLFGTLSNDNINSNIKKFEHKIVEIAKKYDKHESINDSTTIVEKHMKELLFKCKYCDKSFTTQNGANYHQFKYCNNKPTTYKKTSIPSPVKRLVWNKYVGEEIGKSKCYCCN